MTEERITETETPSGNTRTTTIIRDSEPSSGGSKWGIVLVIIVLAAIALFVFTQMGNAEIAKDTAVADAAENVGEAAGQVGDAAQNVGDAAQDAVDKVSE